MKRGAENQLTKDSVDDDDEEVSQEAFKKADETTLAARPMRGLPKRSLAGTPSPGLSPTQLPDTRFTGFTGFGAPSGSTPPSMSSNTPPSQSSFFFKPPSSALPTLPTVAPTASNTAKTFASFLGNTTPQSDVAQSTPPQNSASPISSDAADVDDPALFKYYTSLRGLNVSFLAALSKATEEDPFRDITELLELYKNLRVKVQSEFDERPNSVAGSSPAPLSTMPAPPVKFGFGPPVAPSSTTSQSNKSTFTPILSPAAPTSGLSFGSPATTTVPSSATGFSFATPPASSKANPLTSPQTSGFSSSSVFDTSISTSTFSPFNTSTKSTSSPTPFAFGAPSLGTTSNTNAANSLFRSTTSSSTTNIFGTSGSFGGSTPLSMSAAKPSSFGGFGGFGKSSGGSIGNPVGFGFGSPSKTSDTEAVANGNGDEAEGKGNEGDDGSEGATEAEANVEASGLLGNNPHDEEGEGEEQEETVYAVKLKAFRLRKTGEIGGPGWAELGYGVLRLKKHKENDSRRMLLRNSSTGKIILNFNLYSGLTITQSKRALTFIGHDEGNSQTYSVRLRNEDQAKALEDALEKEILLMTPKSGD